MVNLYSLVMYNVYFLCVVYELPDKDMPNWSTDYSLHSLDASDHNLVAISKDKFSQVYYCGC